MIQTFLKETEVNGQKVWKTFAQLSDLRPDPQNPKDITEDKLEDLMYFLSKYETLEPLLVDAREDKMGQLIGGNKRLEALLKMGKTEEWVEFRTPVSDAEAFEIGTVHNMNFGQYVEDKLKVLTQQYQSEIDIAKLNVEMTSIDLDELIKPQKNKGMKYEIIIKCDNEDDLMGKMQKLNELGISAKKRGK